MPKFVIKFDTGTYLIPPKMAVEVKDYYQALCSIQMQKELIIYNYLYLSRATTT